MSWPKRPFSPAQSQYSPPARVILNEYQSAPGSSGILSVTDQRPSSSDSSKCFSKPSPLRTSSASEHGARSVRESERQLAPGLGGAYGTAAALTRRIMHNVRSEFRNYHISANLAGMSTYMARSDPARPLLRTIYAPAERRAEGDEVCLLVPDHCACSDPEPVSRPGAPETFAELFVDGPDEPSVPRLQALRWRPAGPFASLAPSSGRKLKQLFDDLNGVLPGGAVLVQQQAQNSGRMSDSSPPRSSPLKRSGSSRML